tara:strand:- start:921 stop:1598 length:678 start_codon:yes stop_codon:yes gene_type:complete
MESAIVSGPVKVVGSLTKLVSSIAGKFGIQFSIASIMKQSQIFTGALGSIFQLLGAFVDVMLAPFMPMFVRLLQRMVTWIPIVQEKAEAAAAWLENAWITNEGDVMSFVIKALLKGVSVIPWGNIVLSILSSRAGAAIAAIMIGYAMAPYTGGLSAAVGWGFATGMASPIGGGGKNQAIPTASGVGGAGANTPQGLADRNRDIEEDTARGWADKIYGGWSGLFIR